MPKATLEQWRMFKAVADHQGFNQAAQAIHKSQSSIHHAVHKLEETLGIKLFDIQGRKAVLTEHGALLLKRGSYLLEEALRIESVADSLSTGLEASLCIAIDEAFPSDYLYQVLEAVAEVYPLLQIEIIESVLGGCNELIEAGRANLGLSPIPLDQGLNEEICQVNFIAVANPEHPLAKSQHALDYNDLKSSRQIVVRDSALNSSTDAGWLGADQRWTVSHLRSSIDLVGSGLGFAWLPEPAIAEQLESGQLVPLQLNRDADRSLSFFLNYKDADKLGPAALEFMGQLRLLTPSSV